MSSTRLSLKLGTVVVTILIGLSGCMAAGTGGAQAAYPSVSVQQVPSTVTTLDLSVTGPGMTPIQQSGISPGTTSLIVEVPVGSDRVFRLLGQVYDPSNLQDPNINSFVQSFGDEKVQAVSSEGVSLSFDMQPFYTKVIFPSFSYISQYDRTLSTAYVTLNPTLSNLVGLGPVAVDLDATGRLYVANSFYDGQTFTYHYGIFRMDDAASSPFEIDLSSFLNSLDSLAVDSQRGLIYFVGTDKSYSPIIGSVRTDGTNIRTDYDVSQIPFVAAASQSGGFGNPYFTGIDVGPDGTLYISGYCSFEVLPTQGGVTHYDPTTQGVLSSYDGSPNEFVDVMRKGKYVYTIRYQAQGLPGSQPNGVIELTPQLGFVDSMSGTGDPTLAPGQFSNPSKFAAPENPGFYVINGSYIIHFDDLSGAGWNPVAFG